MSIYVIPQQSLQNKCYTVTNHWCRCVPGDTVDVQFKPVKLH